MNAERWIEVKKIVSACLDAPPEGRERRAAELCGSDRPLFSEVQSLLASHAELGGFLEPSVPEEEPEDLLTGQRIGNYEVCERIAEGGMGAVYRAMRTSDFQKQVAIKVVKRGMDTNFILRRFRDERQILAALDHPNIARLTDGGATPDGRPYLVMDYVEGAPVTDYCESRRLTVRERLQLFRTICSAVQYAHQNLVVHRDLKPRNILVTSEGIPKLLDFGIAKLMEPDADVTMTSLRLMTPECASPEQVRGDAITTATDVYALGVLLYQLLTGEQPYDFSSRSVEDIRRTVCETEPKKPSTIRPLSEDLDNIVLKAMHKDPAHRYVTAEQLSDDIGRYLAGLPVSARKDTFRYRASKFVVRHKTGSIAAALVAFSLIGGMAATLWMAVRASRAEAKARAQQARAERRFNDVRKLANSFMFDFNDAIQNVVGTTRARELVVKTALQYIESLSRESAGDPSLQNELATAYEKVGDIQGILGGQSTGNVTGALDSYRKALTIRKASTAEAPADAAARRQMAYTYRRIGGMLGQQNDFVGALDNDRHAVDIYRALSDSNPSDYAAGWDKAISYQQLGYHLALKGDLAEAVANHSRAVSVFEHLLTVKPGDQRLQLELAHSYRLTANALAESGDRNGALEMLKRGIPVSERIARDAPNNVRAKLDLASGYGDIADILDGGGDQRGALENSQKALKIEEGVAKSDPNDVRAKILLANVYARVNLLQIRLGVSGGEQGLIQSLNIRRQLLSNDPDNDGRKEAVGNSYQLLGDAEISLASSGRRSENPAWQHWRSARSWYKQALDIMVDLQTKGELRGYDARRPNEVRQALAKCDAALAKLSRSP